MQCMLVKEKLLEENIHQRKYLELRKVLKRWKTRNVKWRSQTSTIKTLHTSSASSISSGPSIMSFLC